MLNLDSLLDNLSGFVETRLELFKLEVREEVANVLAKSLLGVFHALCLFFFVVFLSVGVAIWIGREVGLVGGFIITGGFYLFITLILIVFRKPVFAWLEQVMQELVKGNKMKSPTGNAPPPENGQEN